MNARAKAREELIEELDFIIVSIIVTLFFFMGFIQFPTGAHWYTTPLGEY